jgi:hypothetical protein
MMVDENGFICKKVAPVRRFDDYNLALSPADYRDALDCSMVTIRNMRSEAKSLAAARRQLVKAANKAKRATMLAERLAEFLVRRCG